MALDLTKLKNDFQMPKNEVDEGMRRQFNKMKKKLKISSQTLASIPRKKALKKRRRASPAFLRSDRTARSKTRWKVSRT